MPGDKNDSDDGPLDAVASLKEDIRLLMSLAEDDPAYPQNHTGIFLPVIEEIIPETARCWFSEAAASILRRFGLGRGGAE